MNCRLRPARPSDSAALLRWRNDPRVYRRYFTPRPVAPAEHAAWLAAVLRDPRRRLFVIEDAAGPCGQVRLDLGRSGAEVSVAVAPSRRGRGYAVAALKAAAARAARLGARRLFALTYADNVASAVAFLKAGFTFARAERRGGRAVYRLERGPR